MKQYSKGSSNKDLALTICIALFAVVGITVVALDYSNAIKIGIFPKHQEKEQENGRANN